MEYELHTTHERGGAVLEDKHRLEDQVASLQNAQMSLQAHMQQLQVICRSGSGLNNLFKDSSPLGDMKNYAIKVRHDVKLCVVMKTCVMTSCVHHSERGSVIFDSLVFYAVLFVFLKF